MVTQFEFIALIIATLFFVYATDAASVKAHDVATRINVSICGDAITQSTEVCDRGPAFNTSAYASSTAERTCTPDCMGFGPYCGDGILQVRFSEQCDDGNNTSGDLCSSSCQSETAVPPAGTITGSPEKGPVPPSASTEGAIPGTTQTKVILRGKAYPNADISILLDGKKYASVRADTNADFLYSATDVTPGTANFSFIATDQNGVNSTMMTTVFEVIQSAVTTVANIFIPPTISIDKTSGISPGDLITIFGQSVPSARVVTEVHSATTTVLSDVDETGSWALQLDTGSLGNGYHTAKSYFQLSSQVKSGFGKSLSFFVGEGSAPGEINPDLNGDGKVNLIDFSIFLTDWGTDAARSDFNRDGIANLADFSILLFRWTG